MEWHLCKGYSLECPTIAISLPMRREGRIRRGEWVWYGWMQHNKLWGLLVIDSLLLQKHWAQIQVGLFQPARYISARVKGQSNSWAMWRKRRICKAYMYAWATNIYLNFVVHLLKSGLFHASDTIKQVGVIIRLNLNGCKCPFCCMFQNLWR